VRRDEKKKVSAEHRVVWVWVLGSGYGFWGAALVAEQLQAGLARPANNRAACGPAGGSEALFDCLVA
jgi:hypothetical protein